MDEDELLDLVNDNDEVIGTVLKSVAHQNPVLIHREIGIGIFTKSELVLLQRRSMKKKNGPGEWKISAAGHVEAGEDPKLACKREVKEELGLDVEPIFFEKRYVKRANLEARFVYIYYVVLDKEIEPTLYEEEVMDSCWVSIKKLDEFAKDNDYDLNGHSHQMILKMAKEIF